MFPYELLKSYITDIIDILLVAVVIYYLILLVRGTRAVQLLKGILIIVAVWILSKSFQLGTLQWLMSQAFNLGVFAILIIFQPELRRALEHLGSGLFFGRNRYGEEEIRKESIVGLVKTTQYLAKRRIGALMAVERKTGLSEYIETGTKLEAQISSELLINIFIPNTPLHDGAVIMSGNRIIAAGCYLPLSGNSDISKDLGTRHRAGIGLSEVSDAIVIIVSEETGQVSIAIGGSLMRDMSEEAIQQFLTSTLIIEKEAKGFFWQRRGTRNG
jgi:diadenylate cyclase